jgi:phospholipid/cholesterol/gamma-HCH transport system substrate-binding protein
METRGSYLLVGAFVLLLVGGTLAFLIWLLGVESGGGRVRYDVIYEGSVTGLREGSAVRMNGVRVGDVMAVGLEPSDPRKVRIGIELSESTPVNSATRANLELEGLTGGRYLQLSGTNPNAPPLTPTPGELHMIIPADPSAIDQLLEGAPDLLANINDLLVRANRLLSDRNLQNISQAFDDLAQLTDALARNSGRLDSIIANVDDMLSSLKNAGKSIETFMLTVEEDAVNLISSADSALADIADLAERLKEGVESASSDVRALVVEVREGARNFSDMTGQISALVAENREPLRDFTAQGLFELINFLTEAREVVSSLRKITTEVERDPARFLFGDQQEGYEPQQQQQR